jgi:hypothetical protein
MMEPLASTQPHRRDRMAYQCSSCLQNGPFSKRQLKKAKNCETARCSVCIEASNRNYSTTRETRQNVLNSSDKESVSALSMGQSADTCRNDTSSGTGSCSNSSSSSSVEDSVSSNPDKETQSTNSEDNRLNFSKELSENTILLEEETAGPSLEQKKEDQKATTEISKTTLQCPPHLQRELQCAICHDCLYQPVSLSCGHSFCHSCCCKWWCLAEKISSQRRSLCCPTCRRPCPGESASSLGINTSLRACVEALLGPELSDPSRIQSAQQAELDLAALLDGKGNHQKNSSSSDSLSSSEDSSSSSEDSSSSSDSSTGEVALYQIRSISSTDSSSSSSSTDSSSSFSSTDSSSSSSSSTDSSSSSSSTDSSSDSSSSKDSWFSSFSSESALFAGIQASLLIVLPVESLRGRDRLEIDCDSIRSSSLYTQERFELTNLIACAQQGVAAIADELPSSSSNGSSSVSSSFANNSSLPRNSSGSPSRQKCQGSERSGDSDESTLGGDSDGPVQVAPPKNRKKRSRSLESSDSLE